MNARKRRHVPSHNRRGGDRRWRRTVVIWTVAVILATIAIALLSVRPR